MSDDRTTDGTATAPIVDPARALPHTSRDDYEAAVAQARRAAAAYYAGEQSIDDADYDALYARITASEREHPAWRVADSPTAVVGTPGGDIEHSTPMLSIGNVFNSEGLHDWAAKLDKALGHPATSYSVEPKIDGLAIAARYAEGRLVLIATRGDGHTGEDVTSQARLVAGLPARLSAPVTIEVRGEVYMTDADFAKGCDLRLAHGEPVFANPRSAAAGSLRAQRVYDVPLSFMAYAAHGLPDEHAHSHSASIAYLGTLGVATTAQSSAGLTVCTDIDEVTAAVAALGARRGELGFGIDGVVVKADLTADQAKAGFSTRAPRWGTAYKFPADTRTTKLLRIDVQVGRTGVITPVAVLEPVQVGGVVVTSATLHNFTDLERRDVRAGDTVHVRRAGDVIPEITGAVHEARPVDAEPYSPPVQCPRCGGDIDRGNLRWRCARGRACGEKATLLYYTSRDAMDIEGLGEKILDALLATGHITDAADLYALDVPTLAAMDRLGTVSATNLVGSIAATKARPLSRVLTGLGIRMTGRTLSRRIARHFGTMDAILAATPAEWEQVDGIGSERAAVIIAELAEVAPLIAKLAGHGVNMTEPTGPAVNAAPDSAAGSGLPLRRPDGTPMTVVVTGSVPGLTRNQGNEAVEELGGKSSGSVSAKTDFVVVGDGAGSKATKAADLGLPILDADKFAQLLTAHRTGDHDTATTILHTVARVTQPAA
ncbi:DNA ligase 2 [Catellatospora methionotrophica]|uniref:DNA ligase n=1 Tax=Catellatospora methionotrophica TaxID=121620 RepID=A0A8J3PEV3_9ACTN|nr:NAD-dependent DNA ligase LigA [Catellatospora methionotrophica]GIG12551.1 DNA ligase 2 [Catellatospora methionotrophica]